MAMAESLVRKLACCEFCIPDISQSITFSHLKAGCYQNVCSSKALWVCDNKTEWDPNLLVVSMPTNLSLLQYTVVQSQETKALK